MTRYTDDEIRDYLEALGYGFIEIDADGVFAVEPTGEENHWSRSTVEREVREALSAAAEPSGYLEGFYG